MCHTRGGKDRCERIGRRWHILEVCSELVYTSTVGDFSDHGTHVIHAATASDDAPANTGEAAKGNTLPPLSLRIQYSAHYRPRCGDNLIGKDGHGDGALQYAAAVAPVNVVRLVVQRGAARTLHRPSSRCSSRFPM